MYATDFIFYCGQFLKAILGKLYVIIISFIAKTFMLIRKYIFRFQKKEQTPYEILNISTSTKYPEIKKAYKIQLFKYRPTIQNDNTERTKLIMNAYNTLKSNENIYIDTDFLDDQFYERMGEVLSNLEDKKIIVTENNVKSKIKQYSEKYKNLSTILKIKYLKNIMPKTKYVENQPAKTIPKKKKEKKSKEFKCEICRKEYKIEKKYIEHLNGTKHKKMCDQLGIKCEKKIETKTEKKNKNVLYQNNKIVDTVFPKADENTQSTKSIHYSEPVHFLTCSYCGDSFSTRKDLVLHLQKH